MSVVAAIPAESQRASSALVTPVGDENVPPPPLPALEVGRPLPPLRSESPSIPCLKCKLRGITTCHGGDDVPDELKDIRSHAWRNTKFLKQTFLAPDKNGKPRRRQAQYMFPGHFWTRPRLSRTVLLLSIGGSISRFPAWTRFGLISGCNSSVRRKPPRCFPFGQARRVLQRPTPSE